MKKTNLFLALILFVMAGCAGGSKQSTGELIVVDVTKNYPKKEIKIQDVMDVEYIALDSSDEFLCGGVVKDVGENIIVVGNERIDGNIYLFDRSGKGLRKINRRGQGPGEYPMFTGITLDEGNNELIVSNLMGSQVLVYDLFGSFKRGFKYENGYNAQKTLNFDREHLMCAGMRTRENTNPPFFILTKQDGTVTNLIELPGEEIQSPEQMINDFMRGYPHTVISVPCRDNWALVDSWYDTVYMYTPDHKMTPVMVRTPSKKSNPEVDVFPYLFTDRYCIMRKDVNGEQKHLIYDSKGNAIFEYIISNDDYPDKSYTLSKVDISSINDIVSYEKYEAFELIEANKEGKLKGRLKEIASQLKDDDNPVIMLMKHKK